MHLFALNPKINRANPKPYNLTYFIRLFAVSTFADHKSIPFNRKPYKMFYIGGFIMKTIKESINSKEFKKLMRTVE